MGPLLCKIWSVTSRRATTRSPTRRCGHSSCAPGQSTQGTARSATLSLSTSTTASSCSLRSRMSATSSTASTGATVSRWHTTRSSWCASTSQRRTTIPSTGATAPPSAAQHNRQDQLLLLPPWRALLSARTLRDGRGVFDSCIIEGGFNSDTFLEALVQVVLPHMNAFPDPRSVLLLDNCNHP